MRVAIAHPARLSDTPLDVAVVIDVLRATSTVAVLAHRGAAEIRVVATVGDLGLLPQGRHLIFSELADVPRAFDRLDNSPTLAREADLDGRIPVLVTTNGSRALCAAAVRARVVLAASFLNAGAVARFLREADPAHVALVPAGRFDSGEARAEDDSCARFLAERLSGGDPSFAAAAAAVRQDPLVRRRMSKEPQLAGDVDLCLTLDGAPCVPRFFANGNLGRIVAIADATTIQR